MKTLHYYLVAFAITGTFFGLLVMVNASRPISAQSMSDRHTGSSDRGISSRAQSDGAQARIPLQASATQNLTQANANGLPSAEPGLQDSPAQNQAKP